MDNKIHYIFEDYKKLESDLLVDVKNLSQPQKELVALAYINRQSSIFKYSNDKSKTFGTNIFNLYTSKAKNWIMNKQVCSSCISELDMLIPETDDSGGWMSDFMQNALISLYCFFHFIEKQEDSLFVELVDKVLDNVDVLWYRNNLHKNKEKSESIQFGKEIAILYNACMKVKNVKEKKDISNFLSGFKKIPLYNV